jgi:hypothetical protein
MTQRFEFLSGGCIDIVRLSSDSEVYSDYAKTFMRLIYVFYNVHGPFPHKDQDNQDNQPSREILMNGQADFETKSNQAETVLNDFDGIFRLIIPSEPDH